MPSVRSGFTYSPRNVKGAIQNGGTVYDEAINVAQIVTATETVASMDLGNNSDNHAVATVGLADANGVTSTAAIYMFPGASEAWLFDGRFIQFVSINAVDKPTATFNDASTLPVATMAHPGIVDVNLVGQGLSGNFALPVAPVLLASITTDSAGQEITATAGTWRVDGIDSGASSITSVAAEVHELWDLPGTVFNLTATGGNVVGLSLTEAGSSVVREIRVFDNPNLAVTFDAGGLPPNLTVLLAADTLLSVEGLASNLPLALQEISLANTPSTLSGPAGNLPANLTYFNVSYSNVAVVGNASDWPAGLTSLSMSYTGSELNGPSADWPAGLEKLVMRVDSASAQVSTDTLPVSLIYLDVSLNDNTDVLVGPTLSAPDLNRLYLRQTVNTTVDVDGLLAQLDTAGVTDGRVDVQNNPMPTGGATNSSVLSLEAKGWIVSF